MLGISVTKLYKSYAGRGVVSLAIVLLASSYNVRSVLTVLFQDEGSGSRTMYQSSASIIFAPIAFATIHNFL